LDVCVPLLEAALTIAIAMFTVAMAVTTIIGFLQKMPDWVGQFRKHLLGNRSRIFQQMMAAFVDIELMRIAETVPKLDHQTVTKDCEAMPDCR
jgi:hypothetical protein